MAPTVTTDRQCQLTECGDDQYQDAPPGTKTDRRCKDYTKCVEGEFEDGTKGMRTVLGYPIHARTANGSHRCLMIKTIVSAR